ncbi:MAG: TM0106 family RecB-like putative nuclease [Solirubrobacterales bacterium]
MPASTGCQLLAWNDDPLITMQIVGDNLILSASDLNNYLACAHLTALDLARARGEGVGEPDRGADAELLARKGDEHEAAYLARLKAEGCGVVEIAVDDGTPEALAAAVAATEDAMRGGAEVIYQGAFLRDGLRGHTDFLFRVDRESDLGPYSYEVADTKLARRAKPYFILQLCFYSGLVAATQGRDPERIHVVLGDGAHHSFRIAEFGAYFRHVRDSFLGDLTTGVTGTYPEPVAHCSICRWRSRCDERREADDHLSLVANITRGQRERLEKAGVTTLAGLAGGLPPVAGIDTDVLDRLHRQAALQLDFRETGKLEYELREPQEARGFARLPKPSPGDVFFDMEGDPLFDDGGLEYLFGYVTDDGTGPRFEVLWGRDRAEERDALERFLDAMTERRRIHPDLHIYHYNHYEVTALKRLAGAHGTREEELDELLRGEVFVDLYKVVREALLISQPSYSIKKVEAFYMEQRDTSVTDGGDSVIEFERWLEEGDHSILDAIAAYNEDDCVSTLLLRDWLLGLRSESNARLEADGADPIPWFETGDRKGPGEEKLAELAENEQLLQELMAGVPADPAERDTEQRARWLAAQVVEYHHRESRPVYWSMFARMDAEPAALVDDPECIGRLAPDGETPPRPEAKSIVERLTFPPQETKLRAGSAVIDPRDGGNPGSIVGLDVEAGWLDLKRGPKLQKRPFPEAVIPPGPYGTGDQKAAVGRLARAVLAGDRARYAAAQKILRGELPGLRGDSLTEIAANLEESYLFVQGPPGSGKTYSGARVIVDLLQAGHRVGVTANSHKVIHNMLSEVEEVADERGFAFRGRKKCSGGNPESEFDSAHGLIESVDDNDALNDPEVGLTAGTAWHYCREGTARLDYLVIDEAGQVSLADALALATAARNVILLGDPQQLPQVSQAAHPDGSSLSVLEHLLGDRQTVEADRGAFLAETWRMHPDVAAFVSELMYDGRLRSAPGRERQRVVADGGLSGTGLRRLSVDHHGHSQSAPEEATEIGTAIAELLDRGARFVDHDGEEHLLRPQDILVLTPFNAQVRCLEERLPAGVRIGTVDKLQGQEAQIAFYSMATSSGEDVPRNMEFLFSRNRFNVAVSRARCLSVLVCSPRLLDLRANSIEQMRLVNALCAFAEDAW